VTQANIPVLDFRHAQDPERRAAFVQALGQAMESIGFAVITHHGIDTDLLGRAYGVAQDLFDLPMAAKKTYEDVAGGRERGYTSFGVEHAVDTKTPDLKEFWHVGRTLAEDHPLAGTGFVHDNRFPTEIPEFGPVFSSLYGQMEEFAHSLLDGIGEFLGLAPTFFRDMVADGNSVMRVIHYPDIGEVPKGAVRAASHEDINLITVLPSSTKPGLEVMTRDGEWHAVQTPPEVMIVDTGDMMKLLTSGRLQSTTHRVVNPEASDGGRLSMPFFVHPHREHLLTPLVPGYAEPVLAHDFLYERLAAIGVARPAHAGAHGKDTQSDTPAATETL